MRDLSQSPRRCNGRPEPPSSRRPFRLPAAALALLAMLLVPSALRAATIRGSTRNQGGQPIRRVEVTIEPRGPGVPETGLISTTTGEDGEFLFAGVKPGTYVVRARKRAWIDVEQPITVAEEDAGGELEVELVMKLTLLSRLVTRVQLGILVYVLIFGLLVLVTNYWIVSEPSGEVTIAGWGFILASVLIACFKLDWARAGLLAILGATFGGLVSLVGGRMAARRRRQTAAERQRETDERQREKDRLAALVGQEGITLTDLKPCATASVNEEVFEVRALQGLIPKRSPVVVTRLDGMTLVVDSLLES